MDIDRFHCAYVRSKWHMKRVVLTKDELFICNLNEDIVRDAILLSQVEAIEEINDKQETLPMPSSFKRKLSIQGSSSMMESSQKSILICTTANSNNSGRHYCIQPITNDCCTSLVKELRKLAQEASTRAKGLAVFHQSQAAVKRAIESVTAQSLTAFLVVAVTSSLVEATSLSVAFFFPQALCLTALLPRLRREHIMASLHRTHHFCFVMISTDVFRV